MALTTKIESLLFVSIRPLSVKELMDKIEIKKKEEVENALIELIKKYNTEGSGITIQRIDDKVQMVTSRESSDMISDYLKSEVSGELTPASLETLTVIAYRGPITKAELELIRGVNCSMILRNLLIRGLIEERKSAKELVPSYQITFDFLRYLGLSDVKQLPDYEKLNSDENLKNLLKQEVGKSDEHSSEEDAVKQEIREGEIPLAKVDEYEGTEEEFDDEDEDDERDDKDVAEEGKESLEEEGFDHLSEDDDEYDEEDDDDDEDDEEDDDDDDDDNY